MLPKIFKPIYIDNNDLIRIGSLNDGGYILSKDLTKNLNLLISFGISDNWDFEKHIHKLTDCFIEAYDDSINIDFWINRFKKDFIKFLCLKIFKPKKIFNMFKYLDFLIFFKKKGNNFYLRRIGNSYSADIPFSEIIAKHKNKKNIFLKIDIEGAEYEILDEIKNYPDQINGFAIEFHDLNNKIKKVESFIKNCEYYKLIHIHGNNLAIDELRNPLTLEMTFCHTKFIDYFNKINNKEYPISGLDFPNFKRAEDVILQFSDKD